MRDQPTASRRRPAAPVKAAQQTKRTTQPVAKNAKQYFDQSESDSESEEDDEESGSEEGSDSPSDGQSYDEEDDTAGSSEEEEEEVVSYSHPPQGKAKQQQQTVSFDTNKPLYQLLAERKKLEATETVQSLPSSAAGRKRVREEAAAGRQAHRPLHHSQPEDQAKPANKRKHAPTEMRSDRPVRRLRVDADNSVQKSVDPRFAAYTGELDQRHFAKNYSFLEDYRGSEIATLQQALKQARKQRKDSKVIEQMEQEIVKLKQQLLQRQHALRVMDKVDHLKQAEREKVKAGVKKPFYLKRSAIKEISLDDRFQELKKNGKLKKYLERKQKKQSRQGSQWMPGRRPSTE